jgi:hypothetical protein
MSTYLIDYCANIQAYAVAEIEAESMSSAVSIAKQRFAELWPGLPIADIDRDWPSHPTIIDVLDLATGETLCETEDFSVSEADSLERTAPDLLAALESILACDELNIDPDELRCSTADAIEEAQAVIARARGGAA